MPYEATNSTPMPHTARAPVNKRQVATDTARNTKGTRAPVNGRQVAQDAAQAHAPRATEGQGATNHTPRGLTHLGDPADPPGQWQERYSKAASPRPAGLHQGPCQTSPRAMATTDRRAGTQPRRGSPAKQRGPATRATGVRRSYRRPAGTMQPVVRDTPHSWAVPRAATHNRGM